MERTGLTARASLVSSSALEVELHKNVETSSPESLRRCGRLGETVRTTDSSLIDEWERLEQLAAG